MLDIRPAKLNDLKAITEIYNHAVLTTVATFDTEPRTEADQKTWFAHHGPKNPLLVATLDNVIIGWVSLSEWSNRLAYSDTAEISLYVKQGFQNKGIGRKLLDAIIREGENAGLHTVIARIVEGNSASIHLCEATGFTYIGVMKEVGRKFGKLLDVYLMQKIYPLEVPPTPR